MERTISLLGLCGSSRANSINGRLLRGMADCCEAASARVVTLSLRDFPMPLYDGDLEEAGGVPATAVSLRRKIMEHDGLLIACPEHNGSVSALLKNTLDWCSRAEGGLGGLAPFRRKPALIVGTSISPFGGLRAIGHLRAILSKMGAVVYPEDLAVPDGANAFSPEGTFVASSLKTAASNLSLGFADFVACTTAAAR